MRAATNGAADPAPSLESRYSVSVVSGNAETSNVGSGVDGGVTQAMMRGSDRQLAAVRAFMELPEAESLAAANKRIGNILKKSEATAASPAQASPVSKELLQDPKEKDLFAALQKVAGTAGPKFDRGDYEGALKDCASLRATVDAFFDTVMVNAEDQALRRNRHALLRELHTLMNRIADLSKLAT